MHLKDRLGLEHPPPVWLSDALKRSAGTSIQGPAELARGFRVFALEPVYGSKSRFSKFGWAVESASANG